MSYLFLALAIVLELLATSVLKSTKGFSVPLPTALCLLAYAACFFFFSRALLRMNLGVAYATWCGVGIVASVLISVFLYHQEMPPAGIFGVALIVVGCVIVNLFGGAH